ncbi:arginase [Tetragenococcus halophilus subsp. flandriensis]|uniref:arginase family protein n=1 Tax=Tetragenococcus halophilus TaxID=51669 RepID=UPI0023E909EF|nr:arginase family protein [Tetragenococcus halophilus]GMA08668.1 arginase [Tetragenococcus halophilus subsp. flandriensis]
MVSTNKTVRLLFPQWQGGNNPDYAFGAELLSHIVPQNESEELFRVPVKENFTEKLTVEEGIEGEGVLFSQLTKAKEILNKENPDRVITLGGDCAVSQAPFDYLKRKYKENTGILWLDAHPDIARLEDSKNSHEMVLGNLLGRGAPQLAEKVENQYAPEQVFLAGLQYDELRDIDQDVNRLNLSYAKPEELKNGSSKILEWMKENHIEHLAVHFDLDVLSPRDFRSIYPGEPYLESFDEAAVGDLKLKEVVRILADVSTKADIVGLSITEHIPWDAINLRKALSNISIFN